MIFYDSGALVLPTAVALKLETQRTVTIFRSIVLANKKEKRGR